MALFQVMISLNATEDFVFTLQAKDMTDASEKVREKYKEFETILIQEVKREDCANNYVNYPPISKLNDWASDFIEACLQKEGLTASPSVYSMSSTPR